MAKPEEVVIPFASAVPVDAICGDDQTDTILLREMALKAGNYVRSFAWCDELHEQYFGDGVGGVAALFLHRVTIRGVDGPEWIWVIVGDLPSVYMEFEAYPNPRAALDRYIEGMEEWLAACPEDRASGDIIPIEVPSEPEWIEALAGRMKMLRKSILPHLRDS